MGKAVVHTLDLHFQNRPQTIAAYLIPHKKGAVLVECGPGSTVEALKAGLRAHGYSPAEVTDLLVTHIHLDHAGAAGWLARQGVRVHVHPVGYPHLLNPEKLLASAGRIYGDQMQPLWGDFLAVPRECLVMHQDGEAFEVHGLEFLPVDTPGHAYHHFVYLFEDICFSGDIGGVRMPGVSHIRLPLPPPEIHLEKWQTSVKRLRELDFTRIAPTHFGIFDDPTWHLDAVEQALEDVLQWLDQVMPEEPSLDELRQRIADWSRQRALAHGLRAEELHTYEIANPVWMSADGLYRYWHKHRK